VVLNVGVLLCLERMRMWSARGMGLDGWDLVRRGSGRDAGRDGVTFFGWWKRMERGEKKVVVQERSTMGCRGTDGDVGRTVE